MRLEQIPVILGVLMALAGLVLLGDAVMPDRGGPPLGERRRRPRAERDRLGEGAVGLGMLCVAAALIGRDTWRYGNVAVLAGVILLVAGAALNHRFLRELLVFRGPARRQPERVPRGREVARRHGMDHGAEPADGTAPEEKVPEGEAADPAAGDAPDAPRIRIR